MANDSDLEDEYIKEIGNMKKLDEQFAKQQADIGWRIQRKKKKYFLACHSYYDSRCYIYLRKRFI